MMSIGFMSASTGLPRPIGRACWIAPAAFWLSDRLAHTGEAVAGFAQWLHGVAGGDPGQAAVAIEIPRGAVVETLVEHGFHLYAINPSSSIAFATVIVSPAPKTTAAMRLC